MPHFLKCLMIKRKGQIIIEQETTLFTIANQGAKLLNNFLKDSNVVSIVDCPFVIQKCDVSCLKHFEILWEFILILKFVYN